MLGSLLNSPKRKVLVAGIVIIVAHFVKKMKDTRGAAEVRGGKLPSKSKGGRGNVDNEFFKRIKKLIEIVVPGWRTPEAKILLKLSVLLVARTILSIWLADVNGAVVKSIVDIEFPEFCRAVLILLAYAVPSSAINSGLDYY